MLVERDHIGIFGKVNAGKSTLMNLLTQQQTSIVDPTPGTTADTKTVLFEIHGIGPVKLFDTAGLDEKGELGEKKRKKAMSILKECDLILLVIDSRTTNIETEEQIITSARESDKQIIIVFNVFTSASAQKISEGISEVQHTLPIIRFVPKIAIHADNSAERQRLLAFILNTFTSKNHHVPLLPFIRQNEFYVLNIPMDAETPPGRYLRPQAMAEEYLTHNWAYPVSFRMDLVAARSSKPQKKAAEKKRWDSFLWSLKNPGAVITDSQAIDIVSSWTPEHIPITTFSIMMIHYQSRGRLDLFVKGINTLKKLKKGAVLIAEACNHSRIGEDIGTVQIPAFFRKHFPDVRVDFNLGREFQENYDLEKYNLIIHCGGCMISSQKLQARLKDMITLGIPFTNYGLFLSYMQGKDVFDRVMKPWRLSS